MATKHFALIYEAVPDILERRAPYREAHLNLLRDALADGHLVLAGALQGDPVGSLIIFKGEDDSAATAFAQKDPYVTNGLITRWRVQEWTTVLGVGASNPI